MQSNNSAPSQEIPAEVFSALQCVQESFNKSIQEMASRAIGENFRAPTSKAQYFRARWQLAFSYYQPRMLSMFDWLFRSNEDTNLTYDCSPLNLSYCAAALNIITGVSQTKIESYFQELQSDKEIQAHVDQLLRLNPQIGNADSIVKFGRRIVWYAFARITRPRVIVETGLDKGLGSLVLCSALRRNAREGAIGRYFGTDIERSAGYLLTPPYSEVGEILYGDSITSLVQFPHEIDLFINDSDHSADYEAREYETIKEKLSPRAIILGDNAHCNSRLLDFSKRNDRKFLFIPEVPENHWYPGSGIGVSYQ